MLRKGLGKRWLARRYYSTTNKSGDETIRPGIHKSPITDYLWQVRETVKKAHQESLEKEQQGPQVVREKESLVSQPPRLHKVDYKFSSEPELRARYMNPFGTIRIGRVLEDLDALAGNISYDHCSRSNKDAGTMMLVTASIDRIILSHRANLKDDITLSGKVSWVGTSSMEISMLACSSWTNRPWLEALFTFVARDTRSGKAQRINPLAPTTPEEQTLFDEGQKRADQRKSMRGPKGSAKMTEKHLERMIELGTSSKNVVTIEEAAQALLKESRPRLFMPALALKNSVTLSETKLSNTCVMQPQQQNTAGRIFGGFLVRRAYELAFATAYVFSGVVPKFREIDQVSFRKPVDVGDLVHFESSVLFSSSHIHETPSVHVEVVAYVITPEQINTDVTNTFNFTFLMDAGTNLSTVVPETQEDALRIVTRYYEDLIQNEVIPPS